MIFTSPFQLQTIYGSAIALSICKTTTQHMTTSEERNQMSWILVINHNQKLCLYQEFWLLIILLSSVKNTIVTHE